MKILKLILWVVLLLIVFFLFIRSPDSKKGSTAPDFETELISGESFKLSDLRGNYVLLDFWGSWCAPCLRESPELVELYKDYGDKSFNDADSFHVVSVALEKSSSLWKRAADRAGYNWKHQIVQESKIVLLSSIAQKYAVSEIPAKFLIDPDGNIIGVNQKFDEIRKILSEKLRNS